MRLYQPTYTDVDGMTKRISSVWWCDFVVNKRRFRESTGLRDKSAATARAAARVREEELRAAGIETHGGTTRATVACLLDEYRATLTQRGLAPKHVHTSLARCAAVFGTASTVADLTPTAIRLGLERVRGASAKTVNGYRTAASGFFAWLVKEGRWPSNPVAAVSRARETADGPKRRALTEEEQGRLLALGGPYYTAYVVALNTGLRRAEIAALDLIKDVGFSEDGRCHVIVRAATAKNRKDALLPLPTGVRLDRPGLFNTKPIYVKVPSMAAFRRDLREAGINEDQPDGKVDFHALRVTFATNLARAGVPLVMAQRLLRHSDPSLTANIYTRLRIDDEQAAVDRAVPDYLRHVDTGVARQTGTDDLRALAECTHRPPCRNTAHHGWGRCACGE